MEGDSAIERVPTMSPTNEESKLRKLVVVGQGYVGLPLAMRAVAVGHDVIGYDTSNDRVTLLQNGESFIEDVSNDEVASAFTSGRYVATSSLGDCSDFDIAVITVPTPL